MVEVTIADVAKKARVSVSTVSRILNDKPDVSEQTRQRVHRVIEQLGFTPHAQAQRLAAGHSRTIALLFPIEHTGQTQLELDFVIGVAAAVDEEGFFFNLITRPVTEANLPGLYRGAQADGVILMQICLQDWRVDFLRQHQYPFVIIGRCADNTGVSFIDLDFEQSVVLAFEHLVNLGHRNIGFLTRPRAQREQNLGPAVRSMWGYSKAREQFGLPQLYREVNLTVEDTFAATLALLDKQPDLTGIVTTNGANSIGILRALEQRDRRVPHDVSVVAVATDKVAELITPPLTTVRFPTNELGYRAAKMLAGKLKQPKLAHEQVVLVPQLCVRASTAPVTQ
jgi:DNA-binding LacI/PurR family transcriptional regulator